MSKHTPEMIKKEPEVFLRLRILNGIIYFPSQRVQRLPS